MLVARHKIVIRHYLFLYPFLLGTIFYVVSTIYIAVSLLYVVIIYSVLIEGMINIIEYENSESLSFLSPYFKCDHPLLNLFLYTMSVEF